MKNTTLKDQFQNPIEESWKESKSIHVPQTRICIALSHLAWYRHFNLKWRELSYFYEPKHPPINGIFTKQSI
jgi:hypothetical protein